MSVRVSNFVSFAQLLRHQVLAVRPATVPGSVCRRIPSSWIAGGRRGWPVGSDSDGGRRGAQVRGSFCSSLVATALNSSSHMFVSLAGFDHTDSLSRV
eukprot:380359-Hanusia_phi.AAC.1